MVDIHLEPDEAVVLREEGVKYSKDPNDTRIGFSNKGELILTNHNIIFAYATGMLKKQIHEQRIPLEAVKVFNGTAQIKASKPKTGSMDYRLTVYAEDGTSLFLFPQELKRKLKDWVESINELIVGHRTGFEAADIGDMDMGKLVSHALHTAQPIVQDIADLAAPIAPLVGAAVRQWSRQHSNGSTRFNSTWQTVEARGCGHSSRGYSRFSSNVHAQILS